MTRDNEQDVMPKVLPSPVHESSSEAYRISQNVSTILLFFLIASFTVLSITCILQSPAVSYDASFGLLTWQSMAKGSEFNCLRMALPENLATDRDEFWAAHTPGQFYLPGMLSRMTSMTIGTSLAIVQILGVGAGLAGYYRLYVRTFGFSKKVALLACVVSLFRRESLYQFLEYSGGPLLLFAGTPYFLMSSITCLRRRGFYLLFVPVIFLAGAFLKLSFVLIALSVTVASVLDRVVRRNREDRLQLAVQSALDGVIFLVFYTLLYVFHISKGWTAAHISTGSSPGETGLLFSYSLAASLSGITSVFWSLAKLGSPLHFLSPQSYRSVSDAWLIVVIVLAATFVAILRLVSLRIPMREYRLILLSLTIVHVFALTGLFLGGSLIAEDRHFWPVSAILLPGVICIVTRMPTSRWRSAIIFATLSITAFQLVYAVAAYGVSLKRSAHAGRSESLGLSYPGVSQQLITTIERLDADPSAGRRVFFFTEPSLALLVRKSTLRVATDVKDALARSYAGAERIDSLILVVPENIGSAKTITMIQSRFQASKSWRTTSMGPYVISCSGCNSLGSEDSF